MKRFTSVIASLVSALVLAVLVGTVIAAAPPGEEDMAEQGSPTADSRSAISIVSSVHEVTFADRIDFVLTAESESPITAITFFYRLGSRPISVYGYPSFESGTTVTAEFSIDAGRSSYIPSGVGIVYHYAIEDADGKRLESAPQSLLYLDPAFDWQVMILGNIELMWHDRPRDTVREAAEQVDERLTDIRKVFGLESAALMRAVILSDRREATRSFPTISSAATDSHLYAGFAYGEYDLFVLVGLGVEGMVHEMTHLLLDEAIVSPLGRVPAWYNEGLAQYFEQEHFESGAPRTDLTVLAAARSGGLLPLTAMRGQPGRPADIRLFYDQARSLVRYMVETYGEETVTGAVAALSSGARFEDAIAGAYERPLDVIDAEWRASIGAAPAGSGQTAPAGSHSEDEPVEAAPSELGNDGLERSFEVDPGTFGTSLLLALAFAFAAAVTGGGWLLRRRRVVPAVVDDEPEGFDPRFDTPP